LRAVLDTNVLVSAYVFPGGKPEAVFRLVLQGDVEHVTSATLLAELGRVLQDKFGWDPGRSEAAVTQVVRVSRLVEPAEQLAIVREDPDDDRVLEAAVAGNASFIVSGDRHLLQLASFREVRIVLPSDFLSLVFSG
jgi:putative PIN family toxin of toxin-antitoxin system